MWHAARRPPDLQAGVLARVPAGIEAAPTGRREPGRKVLSGSWSRSWLQNRRRSVIPHLRHGGRAGRRNRANHVSSLPSARLASLNSAPFPRGRPLIADLDLNHQPLSRRAHCYDLEKRTISNEASAGPVPSWTKGASTVNATDSTTMIRVLAPVSRPLPPLVPT
jgi:hypothetical protein